jgi:hypothetical protein
MKVRRNTDAVIISVRVMLVPEAILLGGFLFPAFAAALQGRPKKRFADGQNIVLLLP